MTTSTDPFGGFTPPPPSPPGELLPPYSSGPLGPQPRVLRRSRTDRVGVGVAGGLGEYFGLDPVLFRVIFATAAFFGGAGLLAYLLAWVAIPEQGTARAPIDRFIGELARRRVPVWLVAGIIGVVVWAVAFSWWAPGPFVPIMVVVIILVLIFGRRGRRGAGPDASTGAVDPAAATVNLQKGSADTAPLANAAAEVDPSAPPAWAEETRTWMREARAASRQRRRRALPVRLTALAVLVVTLGILGAVDAVTGIAIPVYLWVTLGIVVLALLVGMILRRTPWSLASLLVPTVVGLIGFGGTSAQLHDGFGQRDWVPNSASLSSSYRLAFGQGVLDLRHVTLTSPRTVHITLAAGQVRILMPPTLNATINANVRFGDITVDGKDDFSGNGVRSHGVNVNQTLPPAAGAVGAPLTIDVHVADGNIAVDHRT